MNDFMEKIRRFFNSKAAVGFLVIELLVIALLIGVLFAVSLDIDIRLKGSETITIGVGSRFEDPGAVATMDGRSLEVKVSGQVDTEVPGTYTLRYQARYLLSTARVYRTVCVVADLPTIELVGGEKLTVAMGATFQEPGYIATDADGLNITDRVLVSGRVDPMEEGTYELTYTVTDDKGRTTQIQRKVTVKAIKQPDTVEPDGKVIYLTFDDGPGPYTQQLLDVLAKYNAKATFFTVNTSYSKKTEMLKAIVNGGHSIGIHSKTHEWSIYKSEEAFLEDLYGMQEIIKNATGVTTTLMRFPGGSSNTASKNQCMGIMTTLTKKVTDLGFQYFDWNVDSDDAGSAKTAEEVYQNVIAGIGNKKTAVVLQHDVKEYSVEAVEMIIQWGLANGYTFQALTSTSPACHHQVNN